MSDRKIKALYHRIGLLKGLPDHVVENIINSQYEFIKSKIEAIDFKGTNTEEEFDELKTNFILKYLGKLHTNYPTLNKIQKQSKTAKKNNKKRWEK